jgi:hypothetical protein
VTTEGGLWFGGYWRRRGSRWTGDMVALWPCSEVIETMAPDKVESNSIPSAKVGDLEKHKSRSVNAVLVPITVLNGSGVKKKDDLHSGDDS